MHDEILLKPQKSLLPLISSFKKNYNLIGGTAIALHLGHRRSIDYDLATYGNVNAASIRRVIGDKYNIDATSVDDTSEYTITIEGVKITFIKYPFKLTTTSMYKDIIKIPNLLSLAAMKAYALGRRAKWKDYVDLYFVIKKHSFKKVVTEAKKIFKEEFNEKLFREQLTYYKDIDYSEKVQYMSGYEVTDKEIKLTLTEAGLQR